MPTTNPTPHVLYECGICDALHPWAFDGDCRDDANRFGSDEDYACAKGCRVEDVEVREWADRQCADAEEAMLGLAPTPPRPSQDARGADSARGSQPHAATQETSAQAAARDIPEPFRTHVWHLGAELGLLGFRLVVWDVERKALAFLQIMPPDPDGPEWGTEYPDDPATAFQEPRP